MAGSIQVHHGTGEAQGVVHITLSHPGKFNAMSRAMWRELRAVFTAIQVDRQARCVLLRGEGGHFCAGGDIAEYPSFRFQEAALRQFHEDEVWGGLQAMLDCDVPILAQIEGNCMGAGVEMASCCDLRVAAASARFGAPIARLGFPMAPNEAALVAQAAGATVARAMLLAAEVFDAPAMLAHGFLTQVLDEAQLAAHSQALAQRIASLAPQAARLNKQTLRAILASNRPLASVGATPVAPDLIASSVLAPDTAYAYADSAEHREGIHAFLAKRKPQF
ncbi:MAG: enoyl-CoA hydratase/isomerase family protein [Burkholderiaceae bacterium]|nr:enoyl-CoA hydratase/isomerase family protein [Burkholderiaceae bacterium]